MALAHPRSAPGTASKPRSGVSLRRLRIALGTWVAIEARAHCEECTRLAIEAAFAAIGDVERRMHPMRDGSDLGRINRAALGEPTSVDSATWTVLKFAQRLNALTRGIFDPCLPQKPGRLTDLELGQSPSPWAVRHAPLTVDCGGIAKGYAIDCAIDALLAGGCSEGLVNAGGDLRVFGPREATVLLRRADGAYQPLGLHESALAVSDLDARQPPPEHRGYYCRVEVRAAPARRYAAVAAADAMSADALTKCALLCPAEEAVRTLRELGGRLLA